MNLFTVQSVFLVLFAGIISLRTVNNRLQILQDQKHDDLFESNAI